MKYRFGAYTLDSVKFELSLEAELVSIEPQVFRLLQFLLENRHRVISKDEIVEEIWEGKAISDASLSSRIKSARRAVGDDGNAQAVIRTVYGQGFRFVAEVQVERDSQVQIAADSGGQEAQQNNQHKHKKPSIAILPLHVLGAADEDRILAEAIPHELIQALSRLRWLFVISRGSTFQFRGQNTTPQEVGKALNVRYALSGSIEQIAGQVTMSVEVADSTTGEVIWGDRFTFARGEVHEVRADIVSHVISALEVYIPLNEAREARLGNTLDLGSWAKYHLGLQHMYRFTKRDNEAATALFQSAIDQDPTFARAYAGLSFTSFQSAFLNYTHDQVREMDNCRRFGEKSVELDPVDPFANFTLGRSYMLQGDLGQSGHWLERSITLNPNYSQGYYAHAFSEMLAGNSAISLDHYDKALDLSPLDPFVYAMLAGRAFSYAIEGDYEAAAMAGERAARAPGAHYIIDMISLIAHSLNQDKEKARMRVDRIKDRRPDASQELFFRSFPFSDTRTKEKISTALGEYGF